MATLIFSYSHKDEALRDQLETHLAILKRQGVIDVWHDRRILPGDEFDRAISERLESAQIVLLLVSPDFLNSDYCYDVEVTRALQRHEEGLARVIPVLLRPCEWQHTPFGKLLAAPQDGRPITKWPDSDEAFFDVAKAIRRAAEAIGEKTAPQPVAPSDRPPSSSVGPRSSNLRVKKEFTDVDRDRFVEEAFEYVAKYFESSLAELTERAGIEAQFKRIHARQFVARAYKAGKVAARAKIQLVASYGGAAEIRYSHDDSDTETGYNESLSVDAHDQGLFLKPMGMAIRSGYGEEAQLSAEGSSESLWGMFM